MRKNNAKCIMNLGWERLGREECFIQGYLYANLGEIEEVITAGINRRRNGDLGFGVTCFRKLFNLATRDLS